MGLYPSEDVVERPKPAETRHVSIRPLLSKQRKGKLENSKLGTADLQRLVLLEQLKLTSMQIERAKLLLNRLRQSLPESQDPDSQGPKIYSSSLDKIHI
nr:unnamed protein product [Callosobruchus analis]